MRPSGTTAVASIVSKAAPERARWPRWIVCQSVMQPFTAEYWHIGAMTMRLRRVSGPTAKGVKRRAVMSLPMDRPMRRLPRSAQMVENIFRPGEFELGHRRNAIAEVGGEILDLVRGRPVAGIDVEPPRRLQIARHDLPEIEDFGVEAPVLVLADRRRQAPRAEDPLCMRLPVPDDAGIGPPARFILLARRRDGGAVHQVDADEPPGAGFAQCLPADLREPSALPHVAEGRCRRAGMRRE